MNDDRPFTPKSRRFFHRFGPRARAHAGAPASFSPVETLPCPEAERVRHLADAGGLSDAAGQSVVVAILQVVACVHARLEGLAAAAMSLAQREKLAAMRAELEAFERALRAVLGVPGQQLLALAPPPPPEAGAERLWWFALAEALQAIEAGVKRIGAMGAGRPRGSLARTLGSLAMRLLRRHERALLDEAEHWMS